MNIVGVVLVALLSLFAIRGYIRGLFREVFSLLGLVVGFFVAARYHEPVALYWQFSPILLQILSIVSLFIIVYLICNVVGLFHHRSAHLLFLGGFSRLGGVLMGVGKAGLGQSKIKPTPGQASLLSKPRSWGQQGWTKLRQRV